MFIDRTKSGATSFDPTFGGVQSAPLPLRHGQLHLRILVDTSSVEVFADKGQVVLTDQIFPDPSSTGVDLFAVGGTATLVVRHRPARAIDLAVATGQAALRRLRSYRLNAA